MEAALLMGILVPLLAGIIYFTCYQHNKVFLQNAAYEIIATASLFQGEEDALELAEARKEWRLQGCVLGGRNIGGSVQTGKNKIQVEIGGEFVVPKGLPAGMFPENQRNIRVKAQAKSESPSERILKIHGTKKWTKGGDAH